MLLNAELLGGFFDFLGRGGSVVPVVIVFDEGGAFAFGGVGDNGARAVVARFFEG